MAGGAGTRLRPLTTSTPKPLLPVVGRPLIEHLFLLLRQHNIADAVVTVQYLAAMIRNYCGDGSDLGMELTYATEPQPLGTAGSVKYASSRLLEEPFLVISGDGLTDIDLTALIADHYSSGALVTMCLARRENPLDFGIVVTEPDGRVSRFLEKPSWEQVFTDTVNTGIYVIDPKVLAYISDDKQVDWSKDVFPQLLAEGQHIHGHITEKYWEDVGTLAAYRRVQQDALLGKLNLQIPGFEAAPGVWLGSGAEVADDVHISGPVVIGDNARINSGAQILPHSVIGRHVVIESNAVVERSVLLDNVYLGRSATVRGAVIGRGSDIWDRARVEEGSSIGDGCQLQAEAVITAGADLYPYKTIEAGEVVTESVVWESRSQRQMLESEYFSGVVNIDMTPESVGRIAGALASLLPKRAKVAVGRDHSPATHALSLVLTGAFMAAGLDVDVLGSLPIPVVRSHINRRAAGGVYVRITPGRDESVDLMLLDPSGIDIGSRARMDLERIVNRQDIRRPAISEMGVASAPLSVLDDYITSVMNATDLRGVSEAGLRIVVDTAGGTCATILPALMSVVDVEVLNVNARLTPDHPIETVAEKTEALRRMSGLVASSRAALGVRLDPTGERLSIVDETGRVLTDDRALLVVLDLIAAERRSGAVALPVSTTRVAESVTSFHGVRVEWTPTGSHALAAATRGHDLILAGDAEGRFVIPAVSRAPDAMAALVQILGLVARTRLTLREIDTRIPSTVLLRRMVPVPWAKKAVVMREVRLRAMNHHVDETEGVRIIADDDSWVLIAPAANDAAIRLWAESDSEVRARAALDHWQTIVETSAQASEF